MQFRMIDGLPWRLRKNVYVLNLNLAKFSVWNKTNRKMSALSKTGLIPSVKKGIHLEFQTKKNLDISGLVVPAPFVLRPFAGIYNPFPHGCSVLCNHPADLEAKKVVKKAKNTWAIEGRALLLLDEVKSIKHQRFHKSQKRKSTLGDLNDTVPEELFRRYTQTDSRPLTPTPTVVSTTTKHSQEVRKRRCMTPDPVSLFPNKERTFLVLDLRRSHSQETITWMGSHQAESINKLENGTSRTPSSLSRTMSSRKKKQMKKPDISVPLSSAKCDSQREDKSNRHLTGKQSCDTKTLLLPDQSFDNFGNKKQGPISSATSSEIEIIKRRGKKKKGKKNGNMKEGEKEFLGFPEPGETQVSTLGYESRIGSTRPSLTGTTGLLVDAAESERLVPPGDALKIQSKKKSFLDPSILKQLQRQLDHVVIESELNVKKKIALEEAFRLKTETKCSKMTPEIKALKKELRLTTSKPEKWLSIPRIFTKQSARFELPMDSRILNDLTPLQYAERYVFPSQERLVLYNHVFNLHIEEYDEDDEEHMERILLGKNVIISLGDIMGRPLTTEEACDFQNLIGWSDDMMLDFRSFTGISSICERLLAHRFFTITSSQKDLKDEIERADFESLEQKLLYLKPDERLVRILKGIRDS